jgi:hypothetical protein
MNKEDINQLYNSLRDERTELSFKSKKLDFKPVIPRLPQMKSDLKHMESLLMGFSKRFSNWKNILNKFEKTKNEEQLY